MMRSLDTMAGRTMLVLLIGLGLFHLASLWAYKTSLDNELARQDVMHVSERLLAIRHAMQQVPKDERENLAHRMSGGPFDAHFGERKLAVEPAVDNPASVELAARLVSADPPLRKDGLIIGYGPAAGDVNSDPHVKLVSMGLGDGTWANVSIVQLGHLHGSAYGTILATSLMGLGVVAISLLLIRWSTRPLRDLANAARSFHGAASAPHLPENGPREVCEAASAFNDMQRRIRSLIHDRTLSLAAISHDLKTPLTRVRFRIEDLSDQELRARLVDDVVEMEEMIDATLAFLRGEQSPEEIRSLDLRAILDSICSDLVDRGYAARLTGNGRAVINGRPADLKRAFSNLIHNAVKYGERAEVTVTELSESIEVTIDDTGPGIPNEKLEAVFAPYYRIEHSRSRETGGVGLGLTVAQRIIAAHGGSITMENLGGGLRVKANLPR